MYFVYIFLVIYYLLFSYTLSAATPPAIDTIQEEEDDPIYSTFREDINDWLKWFPNGWLSGTATVNNRQRIYYSASVGVNNSLIMDFNVDIVKKFPKPSPRHINHITTLIRKRNPMPMSRWGLAEINVIKFSTTSVNSIYQYRWQIQWYFKG